MVEKIPNDVFQFSLQSAYDLGLAKNGPLAAQLPGYGDHGIGRLASGDLLVLESRTWEIDQNGSVRPAQEIASMPFVMVTRFVPSFRLPLPSGSDFKALEATIRSRDGSRGGHNSMMPTKLSGTFTRVTIKTARQNEDLKDARGSLFGFSIPQWAEPISGRGIRMLFLSEDHKRGGPVLDFVAGDGVKLEWSVTERFHLGLPSGPDFQALDLDKAPR